MDEQTQTLAPPDVWVTTANGARNGAKPARRLRGLRMPVLPTGTWLAQVGGGVAALGGVWWQFGGAVAMIAGGVSAVVLGALREAGKI